MDILKELSEYNVTWTSPSRSDRGYMPLGNGNGVMNLWVEENDDLQFYFTTQDAMTETDRCVKMGKVRLSLSPNPFCAGSGFRQTLDLANGCVDITAGMVWIKVFVSGSDVIYVSVKSDNPLDASAKYINWRTNSPASLMESADVIRPEADGVCFYHHNKDASAYIDWAVKAVELDGCQHLVNDMLSNRIFGGYMTMSDGITDGSVIHCENQTDILLKVSMLSTQELTPDSFINTVRSMALGAASSEAAFNESARAWNEYWERSYVFIDGDAPAEARYTDEFNSLDIDVYSDDYAPASCLTAAYILTKFMFRCNSLGKHPLRFNALNFTTMPGGGRNLDFSRFARSLCERPISDPTEASNPDQRPWGI